MKILVTGGAGFIGSAVIRHVIANTADCVVNLDKLTYAGNLESLVEVSADEGVVSASAGRRLSRVAVERSRRSKS